MTSSNSRQSSTPELLHDHFRRRDTTTTTTSAPIFKKMNVNTHVNNGKNKISLADEWNNIVILVLLYTLQGIPLGLCLGSLPFILQRSGKLSLTQIGIFSFASYPYSLKLLWSPIVDAYYYSNIGRRKSWIVPIQCMIGGFMMYLSFKVEEWIEHGQIMLLTSVFFSLVFLVATQDIAVDGWAITMLAPHNRPYASTCQAVGQNIGFFMSYSIFLAFQSADFCNKWFRTTPSSTGIFTLPGFFWFWGIVFIVVTLFIFVFKQERHESYDVVNSNHNDQSVRGVYKQMIAVIRLPHVISLIFILFTCRVAFAFNDNISVLKFTAKGFPQEHMALMATLQFPFELLFPVIVGRLMRDGRLLDPWLWGYPARCVMCGVAMIVVYIFPNLNNNDTIATSYYIGLFVLQVVYSFASNLMFVSQCGFYANIADPAIGGTYMTLLNTISNLGNQWPKFFVFYLVDKLSCKEDDIVCLTPSGTDGYYIVGIISLIYGFIWITIMSSSVDKLQRAKPLAWSISKGRNKLSNV